MKRGRLTARREPTIALINIVFLMLIFFMVAGTLAPPLDPALTLVQTADLDGRAPPDALVVRADGGLTHGGETVASVADFMTDRPAGADGTIRVLPDQSLDAARLVDVARQLRVAGAEGIVIVTERALQ